ncbi:unnamed protein product [Ilex paraguariensis]|uniref:Uncharacterized protein n=1 Tax=Ilex paraguariensis TaxID=185542 RepID=A0ABC8RYE1_9AQUA
MGETGGHSPMGRANTVLGAMDDANPSLEKAMGGACSPLGGALLAGVLHVASGIKGVFGGGANIVGEVEGQAGSALGAGRPVLGGMQASLVASWGA